MNRLGIIAVVSILLSLICGQAAFAQFAGGPRPLRGDEWLTKWWTWMYWWETNREAYLASPDSMPAVDAALKQRAVAVLTESLGPDNPATIRAASALALGRMEVSEATNRLIELTRDQDESVRRSAWMALGLIGDPAARAHLAGAAGGPGMSEHDTLAWIVATGLLRQPDDELLRAMIRLVNQRESAEVARLAMWALRVHDPPGLVEFARAITAETTDPMLCNEALQVLGALGNHRDLQNLGRVYHSSPSDRNVPPALRKIARSYQRPQGIVLRYGPPLAGMRCAAAVAFNARREAENEDDFEISVITDTLERSYERIDGKPWRIDLSWSHGSSALESGSFELRFGLIPLGRLGHERHARLLVDVLNGVHTTWRNDRRKASDPSRGFAAVALGIYLRRQGDGDPRINLDRRKGHDGQRAHVRRSGTLWLVQDALARTARNVREPPDLRAACVLALGLGGNAQGVAESIKSAPNSLRGAESLVAGYAVLALGMLGDLDAIGLAGRMLPKPITHVDVDWIRQNRLGEEVSIGDVIALRAAVLGLGCLGRRDGIGLLHAQFGRDPTTSMELIRSLRWCGDDSIGDVLVNLLDEPDDNQELTSVRLLSAWALGESLDPNEDPRLHAALLKDCNLTLPASSAFVQNRMKQSAIYRYRCYSNEFLFLRLIPLGSEMRH